MDKEWMLQDRLSREYKVGVESFMHFVMQNDDDLNAMSCPCATCGNLKKKKISLVRLHLLSNSVDKTYHTWIWHGERSTSAYLMNDGDQEGVGEGLFFGEKPIDMVHAAYENTVNLNEFIKLLEDAEKPLYLECNKFTMLTTIVKLFNLKAKYDWSDGAFTGLFGEMLPKDHELPLSLYEAKKSLVMLGMDYQKIHACPNDCVLYRKEYEDCSNCPTCGVSRWKVGKNSKINKGVPAKVMWHFPPIPRFQRMFRNKEVSKQLTWHDDKRVCDGYLRHPADSPSWMVVDHKWPNFASELRNLRLATSADGINPIVW